MVGPVYKTADEARAAAMSGRTTAYGQMSNVQGTGNLNAPFIYNADDPFYQFAFATEGTSKSQAAQRLNQMLNATPSDKPGFNNQFDYLQSLLRKSGVSKSSLTDASALSNVIIAGAGLNQDPFTFLENYVSGLTPKGPKKIDTATQYTKQIQTALQFKDLGDARQYYSDSYFLAYGKSPSADLDKKFQDSWNAQIKGQDTPTTTKGSTTKVPMYDKTSKPVIDSKTKKQKVDKFGNLVYSKPALDGAGNPRYTAIVTSETTNTSEGFSPEEQKQFLADFIGSNNPNTTWNVDDLGGAAKNLYDSVAAFNKANYNKVPDLASLSSLMKNVLSSADSKVATEYVTQYQNTIRKQTASKYMGLAEYINAGEDAVTYLKPLIETVSGALEKNFTADDPFILQIANFKDDKGVYRMPNALELNQMVMNHPDYGKTAKAVNEAVDLTQNLKSKLGRG